MSNETKQLFVIVFVAGLGLGVIGCAWYGDAVVIPRLETQWADYWFKIMGNNPYPSHPISNVKWAAVTLQNGDVLYNTTTIQDALNYSTGLNQTVFIIWSATQ